MNRRGRQLTYSFAYRDRSPGFEALAGFIPRKDIREFTNSGSYLFRPSGKRLIAWGPEFEAKYIRDHSDFQPPAGQEPALANRLNVQALLTVRPTTQLRIDNSYLLFRLTDRSNSFSILNNHILRSKWNYQFTRQLSLRMILQYDALLAHPGNTSLETRKNFNADFLLTYLFHPGTAVYVGYNSNLQNIDLVPCAPGTACSTQLVRTNQFLNDAKGFFVKASYLFRF